MDPPFTEWALYGLVARHLSGVAGDRVTFGDAAHVKGVRSDAERRTRCRNGRWSDSPFLVVHSWLGEDLLAVRSTLAADPALAPFFAGDGGDGWLIPAGTAIERSGFARSEITVTRTRLLLPSDIENVDHDHTVFHLRPDRWGADGGGGVMRVADPALVPV